MFNVPPNGRINECADRLSRVFRDNDATCKCVKYNSKFVAFKLFPVIPTPFVDHLILKIPNDWLKQRASAVAS